MVLAGVVWQVCDGHRDAPPSAAAHEAAGAGLSAVTEMAYNAGRVLVFDVEPGKELANWPMKVGAIAAAFSLGLVGLGFWFRLYDFLRLSFAQSHVVVCGFGPWLGVPLARQLCASGRRVVVIDSGHESGDASHASEELKALGVIVVEGAPCSPHVLRQAKAHRASQVFAVTDNDVENLEIALALRSIKPDGVRCHVHIGDTQQAESLAAALVRGGAESAGVFSRTRRTAQQLLMQVYKHSRPAPSQCLQVVLVGFGEQGQAIAREFAAHGHFEGGHRLEFLICDDQIKERTDAFLARFPRFCPAPGTISLAGWSADRSRWDSFDPKVRPLDYARGDVDGAGPGVEYVAVAEFLPLPHGLVCELFIDALRCRARADVRRVIVLCLDDERSNVDAALRLRQSLRRADADAIHTWVPSSEALAKVLKQASAQASDAAGVSLHPFGQAEKVLAPKRFDSDETERLARAIHERYNSRFAERKVSWAALDESLRQSNRERAIGLKFKLQALGLDPEATGPLPEFSAKQVHVLEEMEHNRWLAERLLGGWSYSAERNDERRRHPLLVPYAYLPKSEIAKDRTVAEELRDVIKP